MTFIVQNLNATVTGRGDHTLVLANGLGTDQSSWRHVVGAFAGRYRIVRFDYVGTPGAAAGGYRPARYETLHGHADDVLALLDALAVADATWIGHSLSAMIGALVALSAPERIARLVMISGSPRYVDDEGYAGGYSREAVDGILRAAAADYQAWVAGFSPLVVGRDDQPEAVEEFAASLRRMRPDVAHHTLQTVLTGDYRLVLPRVRQPVTVLQPRHDVAVPPAVGRYLARSLPAAELRELEAVGHLPHITQPAEVLRVLEDVLAAAPGRRAA